MRFLVLRMREKSMRLHFPLLALSPGSQPARQPCTRPGRKTQRPAPGLEPKAAAAPCLTRAHLGREYSKPLVFEPAIPVGEEALT